MKGGSLYGSSPSANALGNLGPNQFAGARKHLGRYKESGAPFGKTNEFDEVDLSKLPVDSHVRLAKEVDRPILRRSYSYSDGINEQTGQFDAG